MKLKNQLFKQLKGADKNTSNKALAQLVSVVYIRLFRVICTKLSNDEFKDFIQDLYIELARKNNWEEVDNIENFLKQVVRFRFYKALKSKGPNFDEMPDDFITYLDSKDDDDFFRKQVEIIKQHLSPTERVIFEMMLDEKKNEEIRKAVGFKTTRQVEIAKYKIKRIIIKLRSKGIIKI